MRHVTRAVIVLVCLISSVDTVSAQTVTGTIRDETGAVLSNVVVEAVPAANGPGTQVVTGENGSYELRLPSAGRFDRRFGARDSRITTEVGHADLERIYLEHMHG